MDEKIEKFKQWVSESSNIVFFGGAGVSTESGIPDFRSVDGLYNQKYTFPPETILSHDFFLKKTSEFYKFYRDKMIHKNAMPSTTHNALARLEQQGKLKTIVTQNIDGLHQMAGSRNVIEIHGTIHKNRCMLCNKEYDLETVVDAEDIPRCECGGIIKPDVVLYGENLNNDDMRKAVSYIEEADVFIIGGTSLGVFPAAGLIEYYKGDKLILINKTATQYDRRADLLIHDSLGKVFGAL